MQFLKDVTRKGGPDFVPPAERIATFDHDGTLWCEQPIKATHAGMTVEEFNQISKYWLALSKQSRFNRPYTELVYQPMLELLGFLRTNGFKTYIVSGGGIEFMRPWTEKAYGVPPEPVIGSNIKTKYELKDGKPVLMRLPEVDFIDDKDGEPVGIQKFIGRRRIAAFGNSNTDLQMLQWTMVNNSPHFALLVHQTDAEREYTYNPRFCFWTS